MRVAALTMVCNEPVWAGVWARHYAAELGAEHCVMLDHGTDDGSTDPAWLGAAVRVERLEPSPLDEEWRLGVVSDRVRGLLREYDAVFHSDADEFLVAPGRGGLRAMAAGAAAPVVTAVGLDVQHLPDEETALDPGRPVAEQRRWVRFSAAMCKPALVRHPVAWCPGFHSSDAPLALDGLWLLHMRLADLEAGVARLARTRTRMQAQAPTLNAHQRVPDAAFAAMVRGIAGLPRRPGPIDPGGDGPPLRPWLDRLRDGRRAREHERYKVDFSLFGDELWDGSALMGAVKG